MTTSLKASAKSSSSKEVKVDSNGNIDTNLLAKELRDALEFDLHYKQTDNMKKRAIRTAGSYDQFKQMVACAHLKTLNRQEVESLRDVKRGWQKSYTTNKSSTAQILANEMKNDVNQLHSVGVDSSHITGINGVKKIKKPKTAMEFERDWNRLCKYEDKVMYLCNVGIKRAAILKSDSNVDVVEQILSTLLQYVNETSSSSPESEVECAASIFTVIEEDIKECDAVVANGERFEAKATNISDDQINVIEWLTLISTFKRFDLLIRFTSKDLLMNTVTWLHDNGYTDIEERYRQRG